MFKEKYIKTRSGVKIFTESIGDFNNPPVILIMGAMNQGLFWYDSFCKKLANNNFYIIRFDYRDTGFSSIVDFQKNPYDLNDLTNDVIEILDDYDIFKVHAVGISMGGYVGQLLAANFPDRLKSVTLISTTADHRPYIDATTGVFDNNYELPYPSSKFLNYIEKIKNNPPKNNKEFRDSQIEGWKIMFGQELSSVDLEELIRLIDLSNKRNKNKFSPFNHGLAVANSKDRMEIIKKINIPAFIFHGESDPCFSVAHGKYLNSNILNSKLEIIPGMGHMFSLTESEDLLKRIIKNL